ncbi:MAG: hypothetical protein AAGC60_15385 [Acidobacteriota bacterium]
MTGPTQSLHGFGSIVREELHSWRLLLVAALLSGFVPLTAPLFVPSQRADGDLPIAVALLGAALLAAVTALGAGSSLLSRDLAGGRLGYYLRQPLSAAGLWLGRVAAGTVVLVVVPVLVLAPTALVHNLLAAVPEAPMLGIEAWSGWLGPLLGSMSLFEPVRLPWAVLVPVVLGLLVALGHAGGLAVRLRDLWTLLDLGALFGCVLLLAGALDALVEVRAWSAVRAVLVWPAVVFCLIVAVGGWLQVRRGGVVSTSSHRVFSLAVWPVMFLVCLGFATWTRALLQAPFEDLERAVAVRSVGGGWSVVAGPVGESGYYPTFLVPSEPLGAGDREAAARQAISLGAPGGLSTRPLYASALERMVWLRCGGDGERCAVMSLDPKPGAVPVDLGVEVDLKIAAWALRSLALDAEGRFLAVAAGSRVEVVDLVGRRKLVSERYADEGPATLHAAPESGRWLLVGLPWADPDHSRAMVLDAHRGLLEPQTEPVAAAAGSPSDPEALGIVVRPSESLLTVVDRSSARIVRSIPMPWMRIEDAVILADGGLVVLERHRRRGEPVGLRLVRWSAEGVRLGALDLDATRGHLGALDGTHHLWVGVGRGERQLSIDDQGGVTERSGTRRGPRSIEALQACAPAARPPGLSTEKAALLVDLDTWTIEREVEDLVPLRPDATGGAAWLVGCDGWPRPAPAAG